MDNWNFEAGGLGTLVPGCALVVGVAAGDLAGIFAVCCILAAPADVFHCSFSISEEEGISLHDHPDPPLLTSHNS